jgi:hypothetical protein
MSRATIPTAGKQNLFYGLVALFLLAAVGLGVFAKNGWLPRTDSLSGKRTGWFGRALPKNIAPRRNRNVGGIFRVFWVLQIATIYFIEGIPGRTTRANPQDVSAVGLL